MSQTETVAVADAAPDPVAIVPAVDPQPPLCACGCGQATKIAPKTDSRWGHVKGQPMKYLPGHWLKTAASPTSEYREIPIGDIQTAPQVRKVFDQAALDELAQSIREHGVIQPLIVRPVDGAFVLVAGERRLRAAKLTTFERVPCRVMQLTDEQAAKLQLLENLQRRDLDAIEEAEGYDALIREHGARAVDLARELGVSEAHISNRRRLLRLPEDVRAEISRGNLAPATAMAVIALSAYPDVARRAAEVLQRDQIPSSRAQATVDAWLCNASVPGLGRIPVVELLKGRTAPWLCQAQCDHSQCPCRHELSGGYPEAKAVCLDPERYQQVEAAAAQPKPETSAAREAAPAGAVGDEPVTIWTQEGSYTQSQWEAEMREREAQRAAATEALNAQVRELGPREDLQTDHVALIAARLVFENDHRRDWSERLREFGCGLLIDTMTEDGAGDEDQQTRVLRWLAKQDVPTLLQIALMFAVEPLPARDCGLTDWWRQRCGVAAAQADPAEPAEPVVADPSDALNWIRSCPSSDANWQSALKRLTDDELKLTLGEQHTKDARRRLQAEARRRLQTPVPEPVAAEG